MIEYVYGDILEAQAMALVNPVNCEGVMGKGLALQFKKAYPAMFAEYVQVCKNPWFKPGEIYMYLVPGATLPRYILNAATKNRWSELSQRQYVADCIDNIFNMVVKYDMSSVAVPALGCGEGRLNWAVVQDLIHEGLSSLQEVRILVYPPHTGVGSVSGGSRVEVVTRGQK